MSKSLRSMKESERKESIDRRLARKTMGLGYWGAFDARARLQREVNPVEYVGTVWKKLRAAK